ncbi:EAL and HDOD domain-containing protein [Chitinolyticbacter meiyuanensis]|uniref:EAL and HDOD domain-containing protein n=1 Tax=Chitinolyticbacter meiyuanensis TaxID=682798 RepID=UPI0011E5E87D|nr:EAL domain-containing protein [Chitinolyticbacter meiyuanensis]
MPEAQSFFLGRQPIVDRHQHLVAYELLFRDGTANRAEVEDGLAASASVISHAFTDLGLTGVLEDKLAFINVSAELLYSDVIALLPPQRVVLELLETIPLSETMYARCHQLKSAGYRLALDDVIAVSPQHEPLLPMVDIIKVDLPGVPAGKLPGLVQQLRQRPVQLLAEKVGDPELQRCCHDLGFDLYQGYHYARPTVLSGRRLQPVEGQLLQLMALIGGDAEVEEIEAALKRAPDLAVGLLKLVNSVASGLPVHIHSVRHAITMLGLRQLYRWLQILLYAQQAAQGQGDLLLYTSATRGRFMELLAHARAPADKRLGDKAFLVGMLSLLDVLFARPLGELLAELHLAGDVLTALRDGEGALAELLTLAIAVERGDLIAIGRWLAQHPDASTGVLNRLQVEALQWAAAIGRDGMVN